MIELTIAPLSPALATTATDQIFKTLYDAVVYLRLPPGTNISETDIARQLDVSRQPVRDAFFRLSKLGFVSIRPQRATLITRISERAVLDAAFIRTAIEIECLRAGMGADRTAGVDRLRDTLDRQRATIDAPDPALFHGFDEEFHAALCDLAGQPGAWALIQEQKAHMDRVRYLSLSSERRRSVLAEHAAIVDALARGDGAAAEAHLRAHLGDIRNVLPRIRDANPAYFEADA